MFSWQRNVSGTDEHTVSDLSFLLQVVRRKYIHCPVVSSEDINLIGIVMVSSVGMCVVLMSTDLADVKLDPLLFARR